MLFANVVEEIQSIIDRTDYSLSITYLDEDSNLSSVTDRICRERKPLGIIFLGGSREDFSEDTSSFKVPCVIVTTSAENWSMEELSSVSIDDEKAGETIVDYLIEHGHTKIAEIGANLELSQTARLRHNGYLNSLKKHGITPDERYYERARFSYDKRIDEVFKRLDADVPPVQGIFYDGQVFDAYRFVSDLIRKAEQSVVLIDNYADDTVLTLLDKRKEGVSATIYTQRVSNQFQLDVDRHNAQYPLIEVKRFNKAHDRFLLIDNEVYHIGASIKDLGRKWFGFTLMRDITAIELINRIQL